MQLSLLDGVTNGGGERALAPAGPCDWARARRIDLGEGAWLEVVRRWVPHHAALFERAQASADWELHERQMYERVVALPRPPSACGSSAAPCRLATRGGCRASRSPITATGTIASHFMATAWGRCDPTPSWPSCPWARRAAFCCGALRPRVRGRCPRRCFGRASASRSGVHRRGRPSPFRLAKETCSSWGATVRRPGSMACRSKRTLVLALP